MTSMTSMCEKNISAEVRLIHAEQISLYKFHRFKKKQEIQLKTKQVKQGILNQWKSIGSPKLSWIACSRRTEKILGSNPTETVSWA